MPLHLDVARVLVPHRPVTHLYVPSDGYRFDPTITDALSDFALSSAKEGIESFKTTGGIYSWETLPILEKLLVCMPNLRRIGQLKPFGDSVGCPSCSLWKSLNASTHQDSEIITVLSRFQHLHTLSFTRSLPFRTVFTLARSFPTLRLVEWRLDSRGKETFHFPVNPLAAGPFVLESRLIPEWTAT